MNRMFNLTEGLTLILASASPRRQKFFADLGIPFDAIPVEDEPAPKIDECAHEYVERATDAKLIRCVKKLNNAANCVILAFDTCVELNGRVLGKPSDLIEAYKMLSELNGNSCNVLSAVRMWLPKGQIKNIATVDITAVRFNKWPDEILKAYINSEEPLDKAGAFAIQGMGSFLIKSIDGNYTTVIGLPGSWIIEKMLEYKIIYPCA